MRTAFWDRLAPVPAPFILNGTHQDYTDCSTHLGVTDTPCVGIEAYSVVSPWLVLGSLVRELAVLLDSP